MTQEEKAKAYDEALERAKKVHKYSSDIAEIKRMEHIFPELRDDEEIREELIDYLKFRYNSTTLSGEERECKKWISWLENQAKETSYKPSKEDDVRRRSTIQVLEYARSLDAYNQYGKADIDKNIAWLEKQGEQKPADKEFTFKAIPRLLEMIEPTDRTKAYCQKLIDSLIKEGYVIDAMIVGECLKQMNGEDVPMATMDEQKPINNVEPKFHEGDWIVNNNSGGVYQVTEIRDDEYCLWPLDAEIMGYLRIIDVDNEYHLWSIEDAKDGDVLFAENFDNIGGCVFLFKGLDSWKFDAEGDRAIATGYCCTSITESGNTDFGIQGPDCVEIKRVHPATKEQRDLLFQKMHEAGYMWNEEKKELEKIESTRPMLSDFFNAEYERGKADALQSIEWSEEDEKTLNEIFSVAARASLRKSTLFGKSYDYIKWQNWLKSLKDRYTWKPSEEQMEALLYETEAWDENSANGMNLTSLYNDLKKL